jgi:phosphoglycerate dehydrogenase-like enzyme
MKKDLVIQVSRYFTQNSWEASLKKYLQNHDEFEVHYSSSKSELLQNISEADACFSFSFDKEVLNLISKLKFLYLGISDIDYFDKYEMPGGLKIYSSKGLASDLISEHVLMVALNLIRNFQICMINQTKRKWDHAPILMKSSTSIKSYKIGVLGLGYNGQAIVKLFKDIGCWVAGYSNDENESTNLDKWFPESRLDEILSICDIIIIALPLRTQTKHLLGIEQFTAMGPNTYLINVSRGELIIENELRIALKNKMIKAAALDVFSIEPLPKRSKFWKMNNILISPHVAGNINFFVQDIQKDFINKINKELV